MVVLAKDSRCLARTGCGNNNATTITAITSVDFPAILIMNKTVDVIFLKTGENDHVVEDYTYSGDNLCHKVGVVPREFSIMRIAVDFLRSIMDIRLTPSLRPENWDG